MWRSFFVASEGPPQVEQVILRLLGTDGKAAASRGELLDSSSLDDVTWTDDRPAQLSLPMPVVHPQMRADIARLNGLSEEDVRRIALPATTKRGIA